MLVLLPYFRKKLEILPNLLHALAGQNVSEPSTGEYKNQESNLPLFMKNKIESIGKNIFNDNDKRWAQRRELSIASCVGIGLFVLIFLFLDLNEERSIHVISYIFHLFILSID